MSERVKIRVSFSFFAALSLLICTDKQGTAILCLLACFLHELGHLCVLFGEGNIPRSITLRAGGIRLDCGNRRSVPALLGGCFVNFLLFNILYISGVENQLFAVINLLTAALNLLPIRPLDGGLLLEQFLCRHIRAEKVDKAIYLTEAIVGTAAILSGIYLFTRGAVSASSGLFLAYLLGLEILEK